MHAGEIERQRQTEKFVTFNHMYDICLLTILLLLLLLLFFNQWNIIFVDQMFFPWKFRYLGYCCCRLIAFTWLSMERKKCALPLSDNAYMACVFKRSKRVSEKKRFKIKEAKKSEQRVTSEKYIYILRV